MRLFRYQLALLTYGMCVRRACLYIHIWVEREREREREREGRSGDMADIRTERE